ncbi:FHA domain-containing protein [Fortiea contorta]|uniref:FHA domain-containing protein n=1 Tax=Fortiea contorta TaxID=1892405 RepID=UPI0003467A7A|nr:FHA domain-containing protein [Fortiea contorta]
MNALTLQWHDAGQDYTQQISEKQSSKNPGTVRIGRDPQQCDIVLSDRTVSGLHVEIFFHADQQKFYIRNLRQPNPPLIDGQQLFQGEVPLKQGSVIYLGQMELKVTAVAINSFPETIIAPTKPPTPRIHHPHPPTPRILHPHPPTPPVSSPGVYGLECPKCHKISPVEKLQEGCPWCGTSLAAAVSVLVTQGH